MARHYISNCKSRKKTILIQETALTGLEGLEASINRVF